MTIDEAIKVKERHHAMIQRLGVPGLYEADMLSIEALKAWRSSRQFSSVHQVPLLPGEDEELT